MVGGIGPMKISSVEQTCGTAQGVVAIANGKQSLIDIALAQGLTNIKDLKELIQANPALKGKGAIEVLPKGTQVKLPKVCVSVKLPKGDFFGSGSIEIIPLLDKKKGNNYSKLR